MRGAAASCVAAVAAAATLVAIAPLPAQTRPGTLLEGFWDRQSIACAPKSATTCGSLHGVPLDAHVALMVRGDTVVISRRNTAAVAAAPIVVDTVTIDQATASWSANRAGFTSLHPTSIAGPTDMLAPHGYMVVRGKPLKTQPFDKDHESWQVSPDGRELRHERVMIVPPAGRVVIVEVYRRAA